MTLYRIAIGNLKRRVGKMAFMLVGLSLASAAVVSIFSIITAMQEEISSQLADMGANIIITAKSEELSFQYGGIVIPELVYDATTLREDDLGAILTIPGSEAILAIAPKLIGIFEHKIHHLVIAGTDLPAEFAVKPWLRFIEEHGEAESAAGIEIRPDTGAASDLDNEDMKMDYQALNLERATDVPSLKGNEIVLGSVAAAMLELKTGDKIELNDKEYIVLAVLEANGMAEDSQVLVNLAEAQNLLGRFGELTVVELASNFNRVGEDALLLQLEKALPHASITGVRQAVTGRNELLLTLSRFGLLAGALICTTGLLTVMLTMSAAVRERTREIGIFRAIGFREIDIYKLITTETLLVSAGGGIVGYHGGLLAAHLTAPLLTGTTLNSPWNLGYFVLAMTITALAGGLAGILPAFKAARLDPAEALRFI